MQLHYKKIKWHSFILIFMLKLIAASEFASASWKDTKIHVVRLEDESDKLFYGTAFKIAEDNVCQYFVTNNHVLSNPKTTIKAVNEIDQVKSDIDFISSFPGQDLSFFCVKQSIQKNRLPFEWTFSNAKKSISYSQVYTGGAIGFPGSIRFSDPIISYSPAFGPYRFLQYHDEWYPFRKSDAYVYDSSINGFKIRSSNQCPMAEVETCLIVPFSIRGFSGSPFIITEVGEDQQRIAGIVSNYDPLLPVLYLVPIEVVVQFAEVAIKDFHSIKSNRDSSANSPRNYHFDAMNHNCINIGEVNRNFVPKICSLSSLINAGGAIGVGGGGAIGVGGGGAIGVGGGGSNYLDKSTFELIGSSSSIFLQNSGFGNLILRGTVAEAKQSIDSSNWYGSNSWLMHILNSNVIFRGALDVLMQSSGVAVLQEDGNWRQAFHLAGNPVNTLQEVTKIYRRSDDLTFSYSYAAEELPNDLKLTSKFDDEVVGSLRVMNVSGALDQNCEGKVIQKNCYMDWEGKDWGHEFFLDSSLHKNSSGSYELTIQNIGENYESLHLQIPNLKQVGPGDYLYEGELEAVLNIYQGEGILPLKKVWGKFASNNKALNLKSIVRVSHQRENDSYRVSGLLLLPPDFEGVAPSPYEMKLLSFSAMEFTRF